MSEEIRLPSEEDLAKLTLRAMVAYAARCARRVQPLFEARNDKLDPQGPDLVAAVDHAIFVAEHFASVTEPIDSGLIATAAHNAIKAAVRTGAEAEAAAFAARAASHAADTAARVAALDTAATAAAAADAASFASFAAARADDILIRACMHDYQILLQLSGGAGGTLGDRLDFESLGPLWPEGKPSWDKRHYKRHYKRHKTNVCVVLDIPAKVGPPSLFIAWDPEILSEDDYARLVTALGDVVRAEGGAGIKRLQSRGFGVPVDAGVLQ